jgi:hypothetical protein
MDERLHHTMIPSGNRNPPTDVCRKKDLEKGCYKVVDSLNVSAGRVSNRPNVQDPLQALWIPLSCLPLDRYDLTYALGTAMHPKRYPRSSTRDIDFNLMPDLLIKAFAISSEGKLDEREVLLSFSSQSRSTKV